MKEAKKRYHKKIPKFWEVLSKQKTDVRTQNPWAGLGPFTITWPSEEYLLIDDRYETSKEKISQEDTQVLGDTSNTATRKTQNADNNS